MCSRLWDRFRGVLCVNAQQTFKFSGQEPERLLPALAAWGRVCCFVLATPSRCFSLVFFIRSSVGSKQLASHPGKGESRGFSWVSLLLSFAHQLGQNVNFWHHGPKAYAA